jgi:hypothetical protein
VIINVLSLPRTIALSHYLQQLLDNFLQKEWINETAERLIKENEEGKPTQPEEETEATRLSEHRTDAALQAFKERLETEEGKKSTWNGTYSFLDSLIDWHSMETAPFDLLGQGVILVWSAFEVFFRDIFCYFVNKKPANTKLILDNPRLRNRLPFKGVTFEVLSDYNFNVSSRMGNIITSYIDFSNLDAIRDIVSAFFPDRKSLKNILNLREFWLMNQRRHLLVHRAGYVDDRYLEKTGDKISINTKLRVSPEKLRTYLYLVRDVAVEILNSFSQM